MDNIEEAKKTVLNTFPNMIVDNAVELDNCFVISLVPTNYSDKNGLYVGGGVRVDKETGKLGTYNPMIEKDLGGTKNVHKISRV